MTRYHRTSVYLSRTAHSALEHLRAEWAQRHARGEVEDPRFPVSSLVQSVIEDEAKILGWRPQPE